MRRRAVLFARWARRFHAQSLSQTAALLGVAVRTLASWMATWRTAPAQPRGRPPGRLTAEQRNQLFALLELLGPATGLPTLVGLLPGVPRGEIEAWVWRYRRGCWKGDSRILNVLEWDHRGAVWAMDHTNPPKLIDDRFPVILCVRDLASGLQLAAHPVPDAGADHVIALLTALFAEHGAPLVLKSDNGSGFIEQRVETLLRQHGVHPLFSPPRTPRYNGACEAGIGSMKTRAVHIAATHGRPADWTCDDVEGARLLANETARPAGPRGGSPDQMWNNRAPLDASDRGTFATTVRILRGAVQRDQGTLPSLPTGRAEAAQLDREILTRALLQHGILSISRRRYPQQISRRFRAGIM